MNERQYYEMIGQYNALACQKRDNSSFFVLQRQKVRELEELRDRLEQEIIYMMDKLILRREVSELGRLEFLLVCLSAYKPLKKEDYQDTFVESFYFGFIREKYLPILATVLAVLSAILYFHIRRGAL